MLETFILIIVFIIGIYFGSFFTLATYRLPKKEDITHTHSYCPSCNHKLGLLDLVPVFSYLFLGGKCRYCKKPIGIRYFVFEILTGIVFVLFAISLRIDVYNLTIQNLVYFSLSILYITSLFILAGIEKEKGHIEKSVLIYGVIVSILYIIYSYTLEKCSAYEYVIYLIVIIELFILDIIFLKKELRISYLLQILILIVNMLIFCGIRITIYTMIFTILTVGFKNIITYFKDRKSKVLITKTKTPFVFYICVSNIVVTILFNIIMNYIIN